MTDTEMLAEAALLIRTREKDEGIRLRWLAAYESRKAVLEALKNAPIDDEPYTDEERAEVEEARKPFYCSCVGLDPTCPEHGPNPEHGRFGEGAIAQGMREAMRAEAKSLCPSCGRHAYEYSTPCSNCPDWRGEK